MWGFFAAVIVLVVAAVVMLLRHYTSKECGWDVYLSAGVAWLTSMGVLALVPIDVWAALSGYEIQAIWYLWQLSYWTTFVLTWAVIPIHQGYANAGDFTAVAKLRTSLRDNLTFYAVIGAVGLVGVTALVLSGKFSLTRLPGLGIALSNAFGLFAGLILMSYGLVELPRRLWRRSDPHRHAQFCMYMVGRNSEKLESAAFELTKALRVVHATSQQMHRRDPLQPYMDKIRGYADKHSLRQAGAEAGRGRGMDDLEGADLDYGTDLDGLAQLRRRLKVAVAVYEGAREEYKAAVVEAIEMEDISRQLKPSGGLGARGGGGPAVPREDTWSWRYKCYARPWACRLGALVLGLASASILLAEATISTQQDPDLSVFSRLIKQGKHSELGLQALVLLPLCYMCASAYYSLFHLGIFKGVYYLVPGHSAPLSLLINAALMCRFAAPICYNFLNTIHSGDGSHPTKFEQMMQSMQDLPFFGGEFNVYYPLVGVAFTALVLLNAWDRLASAFCCCFGGYQRFRFDKDEPDDEHTERGRTIVQQERGALERGGDIGDTLGLGALGTSAFGAAGAALQYGGYNTGATREAGRPREAPAGSRWWWNKFRAVPQQDEVQSTQGTGSPRRGMLSNVLARVRGEGDGAGGARRQGDPLERIFGDLGRDARGAPSRGDDARLDDDDLDGKGGAFRW
ncbi:unnamed protein product [Pedinophyceae sp. YPF-701]|nr:unnamed protein product [Pedinophyceae sp. YPF-701]